jgi:hypothetical protein
MSRHDRANGAIRHPSSSGKGHKGRKLMKTRREASGMSKADFEAMLKRLGIEGKRG